MKKSIFADAFFFVIATIWGASFILMKNTLDHMGVFTFLLFRFGIAAIFTNLAFFRYYRNMMKSTFIHGVIVGMLVFLIMAFQVWGLTFTSATNSAFITGLNVLLVPFAAWLVAKRKLRKSSIISVLIASIGLYFLTGGIDTSLNIGDGITFLCAVVCALEIVFIDLFTRKDNTRQMALVQMDTIVLLSFVMYAFLGFEKVTFVKQDIMAIIMTGIFGSFIAYVGQTLFQRYTTPTKTALILTMEPVFALVFALIIPRNNEGTTILTSNLILGAFLVLFAMVYAILKSKNDFENVS